YPAEFKEGREAEEALETEVEAHILEDKLASDRHRAPPRHFAVEVATHTFHVVIQQVQRLTFANPHIVKITAHSDRHLADDVFIWLEPQTFVPNQKIVDRHSTSGFDNVRHDKKGVKAWLSSKSMRMSSTTALWQHRCSTGSITKYSSRTIPRNVGTTGSVLKHATAMIV